MFFIFGMTDLTGTRYLSETRWVECSYKGSSTGTNMPLRFHPQPFCATGEVLPPSLNICRFDFFTLTLIIYLI
jgi:hypothetical protein